MRRTITLVASLLLLCSAAMAQEVPRIEVFGGYSHLIANVNGTSFNLNGASVAVGENLNKWFGERWISPAIGLLKTDSGSTHRPLCYGPVLSYQERTEDNSVRSRARRPCARKRRLSRHLGGFAVTSV